MSIKSKIGLACALALGAAGLSGAVAQESQPDVRMAREVVAAASAFETYTRTVELPGADGAAARARAALLRQIEPLVADGRRVKQAAYDIQHKPWSKAFVPDGRERLAMVKQLAVQSFSPSEADATRLYQAVSARIEGRAAAAPSPVVMRGLALAALALAGEAGDENGETLRPLLTETRSASCVRIAKLNLFQCMAVAGPHYEDVFCLGEHAMIEPGQCMAQAVGAEAAPQSMQTASMLIPIARPVSADER